MLPERMFVMNSKDTTEPIITREEIAALNDDGKLRQRFKNKKVNAKKEKLRCELSYKEYCYLLKVSGYKSSELGFKGENHKNVVLARYEDKGNYTFENCRFITQEENNDEKLDHMPVNRHPKIAFCKDCGVKIWNPYIYCTRCARVHSKKVEEYHFSTRKCEHPAKDELLKLIQEHSFVSLGKMFGVSDNAVRKWCKEYGLPFKKKDILALKMKSAA